MDEVLARKLSRQLKILNFFLVFFTLIFLTVFGVAGVFAYKVAQEVRDAKDSLTSLQAKAEDNLEIRSELCSSDGTLGALIKNQSDICN